MYPNDFSYLKMKKYVGGRISEGLLYEQKEYS